MDAKDLDLLTAVRRRQRASRLNQAASLLLALVFAGLVGFALWEIHSILAAPFVETERMSMMMESNRRYHEAFGRVARLTVDFGLAVLFMMLWAQERSARPSDALLLKLAEERERDLDVPR